MTASIIDSYSKSNNFKLIGDVYNRYLYKQPNLYIPISNCMDGTIEIFIRPLFHGNLDLILSLCLKLNVKLI